MQFFGSLFGGIGYKVNRARECCLLLYFDSINQVQTSISQLNVFSIMLCLAFGKKRVMSLIFKHKKVYEYVLCF